MKRDGNGYLYVHEFGLSSHFMVSHAFVPISLGSLYGALDLPVLHVDSVDRQPGTTSLAAPPIKHVASQCKSDLGYTGMLDS